MVDAIQLLVPYRGPNLTALASNLAFVIFPNSEINQFSVFLAEAATVGDYIFTVYKKAWNSTSWSVLTTITVASGDYDGYSASITESMTFGDQIRIDLTTLPTGATVKSPAGFIINWQATVNADDAASLGGVSAAAYTAAINAKQPLTRTVAPKTANYNVASGDSGTTFTNEGTTAKRDFNLPAAAAGLEYNFIVQDSDGLKIIAAAGDTIRNGAAVSAAAGYVENTTIGSSITLIAINATEWVTKHSPIGTWTPV